MSINASQSTVQKSYDDTEGQNPILKYCVENSSPLEDVQKRLIEETMKHPRYKMLGAPECLALNGALIRAIGAKKVLDIGVFTGASSLSAALALPEDGKVIACDVSEEFTNIGKKFWAEAGVADKIDLRIAPAGETLQKMIDNGESGTYDFAFIDADKGGYDNYYEKCLVLMRKNGIIAFDNTLWKGRVLDKEKDESTKMICNLNEKIAKDTGRNFTVLMNIGDGYTLVVKK